MPMSRAKTKALMRLQSVAEELGQVATRADSPAAAIALNDRLLSVIDEVSRTVTADNRLAAEFETIVVKGTPRRSRPQQAAEIIPTAAALVGWLKGAIEAETWDTKLRADAAALADAPDREGGVPPPDSPPPVGPAVPPRISPS
jgi:hypothetical protein